MKRIMFNDKYGLTKAVLEGRKTMTRRLCGELLDWHYSTEPKIFYDEKHGDFLAFRHKDDLEPWILLPKYVIGEVVAVAQSYKSIHEEMMEGDYGNSIYDNFRSAMVADTVGWNSKRCVRADLMPHQIRITDIKVERLQDIRERDCMREGIYMSDTFTKYGIHNGYSPQCANDPKEKKWWFKSPKDAFADLIDKVSGKGTWDANPWVFVYSFELVKEGGAE